MKKQSGPDITELIGKIQQQLFSIEKKIDDLASRPQSRPPQSFDRPHHHREERRGGDFRERKLYKVVCADCNKECEVPFRPSGDRPVYCKDCFASRKGGGSSFKEERRESRPPDREFVPPRRKEKTFSHKRKKRSK